MRKIIFDKLYVLFAAVLCFGFAACGGGDDVLTGNESQAQQNGNGGTNAPQVYPQDGNPLTLEAIGSGTITFKNRAAGPVSYRIGNGNVQTIAAGTDGQIPVSAGQKISFFGDNATYSSIDEYSKFSSTTDFYAYGNIMSLISSKGYSSATKLTESYTFCSLFEGATLLKSHPNIPLLLPATILSEGCYNSMFSGCTSLTTAPVLPAKTLADHCYYCYDCMFYGCSSLNYVKCLAEGDVDNFLFTDSWLEGVAPSGTFVKAPGAPWNKVSSSCIPSGWTVVENTEEPTTDPGEEGVEPVYPDINSTPLTLEAISGGTITFQNKAAGSVIYKIDGSEESQTIKTNTTKTIYVTAGQKVRFFGDNATYYGSNIKCDADCYIYGNIMSLIYSKDYATNTTLTKSRTFESLFSDNVNLNSHPNNPLVLPAMSLKEYCYQYMFSNCTSLTIAPELPATTMAERCYFAMFSGCKNLTSPPELPATTLAKSCYCWMFSRCTNLTSAPKLPAKNLTESCYYYMFNECSSLTTAPTLPATTMADECYSAMFMGCTSLTEAPKLSSTILAKSCYSNMFSGCTSLVNAPQLPAKTLAVGCYGYMFYDCTSLTTAPTLPATIMTKSCYKRMFSGCKSLTAAPNLPATTLAESCYEDMFNRCSALTMAPSLPATTLATKCYYYMFAYCYGLTSTPSLPATTLADHCYASMFSYCKNLITVPERLPAVNLKTSCYSNMFFNCNSLTSAPELPATTLVEGCYGYMFAFCSKLQYVKCLATNKSATDCTTDWLKNTSTTGTFVKKTDTSWSSGSSGIPTGWTITSD